MPRRRRGWVLAVLTAALAVAAAAAPAGQRGARVAAALDLDDLWCKFGLAGCGEAPGAGSIDTGSKDAPLSEADSASAGAGSAGGSSARLVPVKPISRLGSQLAVWVGESAAEREGARPAEGQPATAAARLLVEIAQPALVSQQQVSMASSSLEAEMTTPGSEAAGSHPASDPSSGTAAPANAAAEEPAGQQSAGSEAAAAAGVGSSEAFVSLAAAVEETPSALPGTGTAPSAAVQPLGLAGTVAAAARSGAAQAVQFAIHSPAWALLLMAGKTAVFLVTLQLWRYKRRREAARRSAAGSTAFITAVSVSGSARTGTAAYHAPPATAAAASTAASAAAAEAAAHRDGEEVELLVPTDLPSVPSFASDGQQGEQRGSQRGSQDAGLEGEQSLRQIYGVPRLGGPSRGSSPRGTLNRDLPTPLEQLEAGSPSSTAGSSQAGTPRGQRAAIEVDPSVRARDISRTGWTELPGRQPSSAKSAFDNPLFLGADGSLQSFEAPDGGKQASPDGLAQAAHNKDGPWQAKQAAVDSSSDGAGDWLFREDSFKLMAADMPPLPPSVLSGEKAGGSSSSVSTSSQLPPPPAPSSPGKPPTGAARKLTAAQSIGPQELPPPQQLAGDAAPDKAAQPREAASTAPAAPKAGRRSTVGGSSPQPELSASTYEVHASGAAGSSTAGEGSSQGGPSGSRPSSPPSKAALRGMRLLTARQFEEEVVMGRLLGVGASGCVYQASWEGQQVAVKVLHPTMTDERSFAREVEVMAAAGRHPSIIGVLAACLEPPRLAMIQELAATSLYDLLQVEHRRPLYGTFLQLAEDIASAMEHCHGQRPPVVHRDLGARNVLLGQDGRARVADFGLAAAKRRTFLSSDKAGALGTAAYMAPEAMHAGPISERCDVFAFAVLLWEMLAGRPAWEEMDSPLQVIFAVGVERRRLPIPPGCPPALARLLKECWRHNAPLRPSFSEVLQRLRQIRSQDTFRLLKLTPGAATPQHSAAPAGGASRKAGGKAPLLSPASGGGRPGSAIRARLAASLAKQPPF